MLRKQSFEENKQNLEQNIIDIIKPNQEAPLPEGRRNNCLPTRTPSG